MHKLGSNPNHISIKNYLRYGHDFPLFPSERISLAKEGRELALHRAEQRLSFVDDDGRGLSPSEREQVAKRGQRIDETKPGSGLGLSIVVELAALYGGSLTLGTAPIGGLRAELVLPMA
jgi:signal transduction histidine kinase